MPDACVLQKALTTCLRPYVALRAQENTALHLAAKNGHLGTSPFSRGVP